MHISDDHTPASRFNWCWLLISGPLKPEKLEEFQGTPAAQLSRSGKEIGEGVHGAGKDLDVKLNENMDIKKFDAGT
jgi:hypothetical protein